MDFLLVLSPLIYTAKEVLKETNDKNYIEVSFSSVEKTVIFQ